MGSCLTLGIELSKETYVLTEQEILLGSHAHAESQKSCSAAWFTVVGFMVMGLVSRLSSANHSDSGSFLVVHTLLSQDGCQVGGGRIHGVSF